MVLRTLIALGATMALCPLVLRALRRARIVDRPNHRSLHDRPVPRGGGLAPMVGVAAALAGSMVVDGHARLAVAGIAAAFALVGVTDDVAGVDPIPRLGLQFLAATLALPFLLQSFQGPAWWLLVFGAGTALWLVAYVNAFNFMDGIDGISVAQATVAGATWTAIGTSQHVPVLADGGALLAAAALGFAPWNVPRARMFLGDVGSYFFGAGLAALAVVGLRAGLPPEAILAPLAVYLADTGVTILRRVRSGETWYRAHCNHIYQQVVRCGWSHSRVTLLVGATILVCSLLGAASLTGILAVRVAADLALVAVLAGYLRLPAVAARTSELPAPARAQSQPTEHPGWAR